MGIRSILVPVRGDGKHEDVLNHALALARRFNAHIDIVHCRPRPEDMLPFGVVVPASVKAQLTASAGLVADEEEQKLKAVFQDYCARHDCMPLEGEVPPTDQLSIAWREEIGKQPVVVGRLGRLADVITLAQPDPQRNLGYGSLEAALFETGRLVLMCPPRPVAATIGHHVAIGWNGKTEVARAIAVAMPILVAAEQVSVLAIDTGEPMALPAEALVKYLAAHNVPAALRHSRQAPHRVGHALLNEAATADADVLLVGAYGQNRIRELVMGGVTRHLIDHAAMPVLLAH